MTCLPNAFHDTDYCPPMFMQFTGGKQPVQNPYWPENAIDWLREC